VHFYNFQYETEDFNMLGDFSYCNPTKLYFGEQALDHLLEELKNYGDNVILTYGGGSIKKNGIYDDVMKVLKEAGKTVTEIAGVMPNPTVAKLKEGVQIARDAKADFILAVGGGSVIDYSKALSVSINYDGDPWEKYYLKFEEPDCETLPVGAVLTMVGTGSEMNAGAVITNPDQKLKIGHVFKDEKIMPRFSILNPRYTMTLPHYQMVSGIYDIFNHICEQYFSGEDDNTSDYIAEGLMRSVIHSSRIANKDPQNYEARSNLMWTATWALNTLIEKGKTTDWMVHMLGQAVGAVTNATHGMTLAAVSMPYYRYIMPYGLKKFARFAETVWNVNPEGKNDTEIAEAGLAAMEQWMKELGLVMNITDLGANESMIPDLVKGTIILKGGYKVLDEKEIAEIFKESL
jgi:alcohol dehydrogenase YqhD (iron-dependent ADH family)